MSMSCFPAYRSESDSSVSTGPTLDFPKQPSIESLFPAYKSDSETDGGTISESKKTTLAAAQLSSYSPESIFPPANSYKADTDYGSSVSNETTPDFSKQLSIPFPPCMSESDTNENYETHIPYSIMAIFPPARSLTDSSQHYGRIPTDSFIATTVDSVGYLFEIFWSSQQSVPILDLNSSESSRIHKNQVIGTCVLPTFFEMVERLSILVGILEMNCGSPDERIELFVMRRFPLRQVSYIPLRYLRWLKECMLKRTIAISSTTQK